MRLPHSSTGEWETRSTSAAQVDLAEDNVIRGYPIVFNKLSQDLGGFRERILPSAADRLLTSDIRALVDHDTGKVLGRTTSRTMTMRKDRKGLSVEIHPDMEISYAKDIVRAVARGDVSGMSFSFAVLDEDWHLDDGKMPVRDVIDMKVNEFSIVTFPAYLDANVEVAQRSMNLFLGRVAYNWRAKFHEMEEIRRG